MHELSLTQSILALVEEYGAQHGFEKVNCLYLRFGRLSCIDAGALQFAFDVQSRGTKAEGARLEFDIRPVVVYCFSCEREYAQDTFTGSCPACSGHEVAVTAGNEDLQLVEMDVD